MTKVEVYGRVRGTPKTIKLWAGELMGSIPQKGDMIVVDEDMGGLTVEQVAWTLPTGEVELTVYINEFDDWPELE